MINGKAFEIFPSDSERNNRDQMRRKRSPEERRGYRGLRGGGYAPRAKP